MSYEYVGEIIHSRFDNYKDGVDSLKKAGRKVTLSRFKRLTVAEDRQYAERFAKMIAPKFQPEKAEFKTGKIDGRHVVAMFFQKHCWLFCEKRQPKREPAVESVASV